MDLSNIIKQRHSVRQYTERPISDFAKAALTTLVNEINKKALLHIQFITDEPEAFNSVLANYGKFKGVRNYFAMVGHKSGDLDEAIGYYGEHLVLRAQALGLNTCWVGLTYKHNKKAIQIDEGEKLVAVISVGYGVNSGVPHPIKLREKVMSVRGTAPQWFLKGVDAALLAPTAMNQQKFRFILNEEGHVEAKTGWGFFTKVDLGIVKYHFEIGAGIENFTWQE